MIKIIKNNIFLQTRYRLSKTYLQRPGFLYAHIYTSVQMHILSVYLCNNTSDYFLLSRPFIYKDYSVSVTLQYLHKTITLY